MKDKRDYTTDGFYVEHHENDFAIYDEDGDLFITVPHTQAPEFWVKQMIRAYKKGFNVGKGVGATAARREIRVALGIESQDM